MNFSDIQHDIAKGAASSLVSTAATNGLLHYQYCRIQNEPFSFRHAGRGFLSNFKSYSSFLIIGHMARGIIMRGTEETRKESSSAREILCGMAAGGISSIGVCPGERLAALDNQSGKGFKTLFLNTLKEEGFRGFYRGFTPTLARDVLTVGGVLSGGTVLKKKLMKQPLLSEKTATFASSIIVGTSTSTITQPLQVLRIKMQVESSESFFTVLRTLWLSSLSLSPRQKAQLFTAGLISRIGVNTLLVGCGILVDENFQKN